MKLIVMFISLTLFNLSFAGDHEGGTHTPNYCTQDKSCAHLMFPKIPNSQEESEFLVHLMPKNEDAVIQNFKVKLWMESMGHGSSPVDIKVSDEVNHYEISKAYFLMKGEWQVIVTFKEDGVDRKFIIPVQIVD